MNNTMTNTMTNKLNWAIPGIVLAMAFVAVVAMPSQALAFDPVRIIDPFCLFACDDEPQQITNTYVDSNNVNSNINSPGATVNVGASSPVTTPNPVITSNPAPVYQYSYNSNNYNTNTAPATPVYAYNSPTYYYPQTYSYPTYSYNSYNNPLYVSCYPSPLSARTGDTITWYATAYGGNGAYNYTWTGTDSLSGYGSSIQKAYYYSGSKSGTVTVISGNQSISKNCDGTVNVYGDYYNNYQTYQPTYVTPYPVYNPYPVAYSVPANTLDIACFADPTSARLNQPTNWTAEVTGGAMPYSYSWTGTEGLYGSDRSVLKYYSSVGEKNAVVTVRSADGRTGTKACSNNVTVRAAASTVVAPSQPAQAVPTVQPESQDGNDLSASALFSLKNVPWGLVGILVILVLFFTVVYLLFNRTKI